jgi:hypothetical protein
MDQMICKKLYNQDIRQAEQERGMVNKNIETLCCGL